MALRVDRIPRSTIMDVDVLAAAGELWLWQNGIEEGKYTWNAHFVGSHGRRLGKRFPDLGSLSRPP